MKSGALPSGREIPSRLRKEEERKNRKGDCHAGPVRQREKRRGPDVSRRKKGGGGQRAVGPAPGPCAGPRRGEGGVLGRLLAREGRGEVFFPLFFLLLLFQNLF